MKTYNHNNKEEKQEIEDYYFSVYYLDVIEFDILNNKLLVERIDKIYRCIPDELNFKKYFLELETIIYMILNKHESDRILSIFKNNDGKFIIYIFKYIEVNILSFLFLLTKFGKHFFLEQLKIEKQILKIWNEIM
jgi:hypothetical protein